MRLLNVHTLSFTTFQDVDSRPRYAIASHRWVQDQETTYRDFVKGRCADTSGFRKVLGFTEYVKHNTTLDWLWIDTCCIDQKSTTEISEAINSMFQWYRASDVCFAYLADVVAASDLSGFDNSDWFTRGWTLQELLAPSLVIFLARNWTTIGHKGSSTMLNIGPQLIDRIEGLTQISTAVLQDYAHSDDLAVQDKLRWLTSRRTTRPEDQSYCMLGILDVSMNIRYGDGEQKTKARLLKKLRRSGGLEGFLSPLQTPRSVQAEDCDEIVLGTLGFTPYATQLAVEADRLMQLHASTWISSAFLEDTVNELKLLARMLIVYEKDRAKYFEPSPDDCSIQPCILLLDKAIRRIKSVVVRLEALTRQGLSTTDPVNGAAIEKECHTLNGAKASLALPASYT